MDINLYNIDMGSAIIYWEGIMTLFFQTDWADCMRHKEIFASGAIYIHK